jgi:tetratricopeptide (TPR) repeat protein
VRNWRRPLGLLALVLISGVAAAIVFAQENPGAGIFVLLAAGVLGVLGVGSSMLLDLLRSPDAPPRPDADEVAPIVRQASRLEPGDFRVSRSLVAEEYQRGGDPRPPYVARAADRELWAALQSKKRFVLIVGASKAGKSRAGCEAIVRLFPGHTVIIPPRPDADRGALRRIAQADLAIPRKPTPSILWLDDIDDYLLERALDLHLLRGGLLARKPELLVIGTVKDKEYMDLTQGKASRGPAESVRGDEPGRTLKDAAAVIRFSQQWDPIDIDQARSIFTDEEFDPEIGLPAYLIGGPELAERLTIGEAQSPSGVAVAFAAIDARRGGLLRPLEREELRRLWLLYPPNRPSVADSPTDHFEEGLRWACQKTSAEFSLVEQDGSGFRAFDYAVALRNGSLPERPAEIVPEAVWDAIIDLASSSEMISVGWAAFEADKLAESERAFEKGGRSDDSRVAAEALESLGTLHQERREPNAAVDAYNRLIDQFGESDEPELQVLVATGLVNKGLVLTDRDLDGALAAYGEVIERFGDADNIELQGLVGLAWFGKGLALMDADVDGALAAYGEVINRSGDADNIELQGLVAMALVSTGLALTERDVDGALAAYSQVIERFGDSDNTELQLQVATARVSTGHALTARDVDGALAAYSQVIEPFGDADNTELQLQVATAMVSKGQLLTDRDVDGALAAFGEVIRRFGDTDNAELQVMVATALVSTGLALMDTDVDDALAAYGQVVDRFGESEQPEMQVQVAMALVGRGLALEDSDFDGALVAYGEVLRRFGEADNAELQGQVANALVSKGNALMNRDVDGALAAYGEVISRFGDAEDAELQELVETASRAVADRSGRH